MLSPQEIKRIQDTRNLMENAGTEGEAASAAAALMRLLAKHNLEATEIDSLTGKTKSKYTRVLGSTDTNALWKRELANLISSNSYCYIVWYTKRPKFFEAFGTKQSLEEFKELYQTSMRIIEHLAETGYVRYLKSCQETKVRDVMHGREYKTSFYMGAVQGFREAFQSAKKDVERDVANGSAIAVLIETELQEIANAFFSDIKTLKTKTATINEKAYNDGKREGKKMNTTVAKQLQTV
jgi:hypothetical protein